MSRTRRAGPFAVQATRRRRLARYRPPAPPLLHARRDRVRVGTAHEPDLRNATSVISPATRRSASAPRTIDRGQIALGLRVVNVLPGRGAAWRRGSRRRRPCPPAGHTAGWSRCWRGRGGGAPFRWQVAYHLLDQARVTRAPWTVTTIVSCLPVLVLAMGTALAHMLRADAADGPDSRSAGPESPQSPALPPRTSRDRTRTVPQGPGNRRKSDRSRAKTDAPASDTQGSGPPATGYARLAAAKLAAAGKPVSRRGAAQRRGQGIQAGPQRPGTRNQRRADERSR